MQKFFAIIYKILCSKLMSVKKKQNKIKADFVVHIDIQDIAKFPINDLCDTTVNITGNKNDKSNNDSANVNLTEFEIYTKILFVNSLRKTRRRQAMDNYTNSSKIDVITTLMTNLRFEISSNKNNFILIYHCQITKINGPDKDNIDNVSQDIVI